MNEIVPIDDMGHNVLTAGPGQFLPQLRLLQGLSKEIDIKTKRPDGTEVQNVAGDWYIQPNGINLGRSVLIIVYAQRAHAIKLVNNNTKEVESFKQSSLIFQEIVKTPEPKDRSVVILFGLEWLVWIPAAQVFATYFASRPSSRPVSQDIINFVTSPEKRQTDLAKELPWTNWFELYSSLDSFGPRNKAMCPHVTPEQPDDRLLPIETVRDSMIETFQRPVIQEADLEEVGPDESFDR